MPPAVVFLENSRGANFCYELTTTGSLLRFSEGNVPMMLCKKVIKASFLTPRLAFGVLSLPASSLLPSLAAAAANYMPLACIELLIVLSFSRVIATFIPLLLLQDI